MFRLFYILENCISKYIKKGQMQRGIAAENCGYAFFVRLRACFHCGVFR